MSDQRVPNRERLNKDDIGVQHMPDSSTDPRDRDFATTQSAPVGESETEAKIRRFETLAHWLDTKFRVPVINYPVGLDGIIGLIPGVGDTITTGLSGWMIYEAHQAGASKRTLATMGKNVAVDWVIGLLPVVGDLFDFAYKSNAKNARLLVEELRKKHTRERLAEVSGRHRVA